jgi:hypothetical protein
MPAPLTTSTTLQTSTTLLTQAEILPGFTLEVAFGSFPFDSTQVYNDLSDRVRSISASWGRRSEEDTPDTGASTTVLMNDDRVLDPTYAAGPYYLNVVPERRIRCTAELGGIHYPIFVHFVDGWPQPYSLQPYVEVPLLGTDGLEILAQAEIPTGTTYGQEYSGTRIGNVLDSIGWPAAERAIDTGQTQIIAAAAGSLDGSFALNLIQDVAATESGVAFIDRDGTFTFHDRFHRLVAPYTASQATFSDAPTAGQFGYSGLVTAYDRAQVKNDWRITRSGGTEQASEDTASIQSYRRRTRRLSTLQTTDVEALAQSQFLVGRYKDPYLRFDELTIRPGTDIALWAQVLSRKIADRITVVRHPPDGSVAYGNGGYGLGIYGSTPLVSKEVVIEAMSYTLPTNLADSEIRWRLSPADTNVYWVLDTRQLDVDARLAY